MSGMTTHERCLATLRCQPVDRAPAYIPAIACEVASQMLGRAVSTGTGSLHYAEVKAWAQGDAAHDDWVARFEQDVVDIHRALGADAFREPMRMRVKPSRQIDERTFVIGDESGDHSVWQYQPDTADFSALQVVEKPRTPEQRAAEKLAAAQRDRAAHLALTERVVEYNLRWLDRLGDEFFLAIPGTGISVGITEDDLMAVALEPRIVAARMMLMAEQGVHYGRCVKDRGGPPALLGGGDLASSRGPMYSPDSFRRIVLPAYRHMVGALNDMGLHYAFRSDGDLWALADMLFDEAACPGFGEADRDATMTVAALRKRYPKLVIWGNMPSRLLVDGTPQQVRDEARRILDEAEGRGCFVACSNAIVKGTPPANVEAMFSVR